MVLDACMGGYVSGQVSAGDESLLTHWTDLIANSFVDLLMLLEVAQCGELLTTDIALKRLVPRMDPHVNGQVVPLGEPTVAHLELTRKGFLTTVCSNVKL